MTARDLANILAVYQGSNGDATKALYADLQQHGIIGEISINLFRACKASERAKLYRGGGYRGQAYEKKDWSLSNLCDVLGKGDQGELGAKSLGITWGWGLDPRAVGFENVLYVDLPTGQVSFHNARRIAGPDYPGQWDGARGQAATRICQYVASVFDFNYPTVGAYD